MAFEVGEWYLGVESLPGDSRVMAAYNELEAQTNDLFGSMFNGGHSTEVRCVFTYCLEPYASDRELIVGVGTNHVLEVTASKAVDKRLHPLLGCECGGAFDRFRAVHDFMGHVQPGLGFDLDDEILAWRVQQRWHHGPARWALATEICGVNCARWLSGETPELKAQLLRI